MTTVDEKTDLGGLIDISQIPLHELLADSDEDSVLQHALKRIVESADKPKDPVCAFNSVV